MFAEFLNDYFFEFKAHFNIVDATIFSSKRDTECPLDIAFIEGAASSEHDIEKMKKLRERAKKVVAIGSCACTGMPSAQRNTFSLDQKAEIQHILEKFHYPEQVKSLVQVISVDAQVPGCPMDLKVFLNAVNSVLTEFGHDVIPSKF